MFSYDVASFRNDVVVAPRKERRSQPSYLVLELTNVYHERANQREKIEMERREIRRYKFYSQSHHCSTSCQSEYSMMDVMETLPSRGNDDDNSQRQVPSQPFHPRTRSCRDLFFQDRVLIVWIIQVRFEGSLVRVLSFDVVREEPEEEEDDPVD